MFKSILIPTDGSELSDKAISQGIALAKSIGAKAVGFCAIAPYHYVALEPEILADTVLAYEEDAKKRAVQYLAKIENAARVADVRCECFFEMDDRPYDAIIRAAEKSGCDLIAMASHGRRGLRGLLLGSETNLVLTHTKIPVLVFR
jgi:nucleotide-binding universal stress UspA family protein